MTDKTEFDFAKFKAETIKSMYSGKPLNGEQGIFAPLLKHFLESALAGELEAHLQEEKVSWLCNRKNGKTSKRVKSVSREFELESTRDRSGTFEPMILPKRALIVTDDLEEKVIGLYGMGVSNRDIAGHIKEIYHMDISATALSTITDKVIPAMNEWRSRPLDPIYAFVYMDCMHYKVREGGSVVTRAIYNILAVDLRGRKDLIGIYISENEGAKFWLSVITDLKNRGVEDILITCVDGLKGFPEAIHAVFPKTENTNLCGSSNQEQFTRCCRERQKTVYG